MSNEENRQDRPTDTRPSSADEQQVVPTRRRVIRAGIAPVVLTLASRPVLAWHCKSPSAWGSEQLNPATSLATNGGHPELTDESWTIYCWKTNTTRAGLGYPWNSLSGVVPGGLNMTNTGASNYYKKYTVAQLFGGLTIPAGLSGTKKVWYKLNDITPLGASDPTTEFQKYMMVARLNYMLLSNVQTCLSYGGSDQLNKMASGLYSPPNLPGTTWLQADITSYLFNNWIVRPS